MKQTEKKQANEKNFEKEIENGDYGPEIKFMNGYNKQIRKLNVLIDTDYKMLTNQFIKSCEDYYNQIRRSKSVSSVSQQPQQQQQQSSSDLANKYNDLISTKVKTNKDKDDVLLQKFCTPMIKPQLSNVLNLTFDSDKQSEASRSSSSPSTSSTNSNNLNPNGKTKKRSAVAAEISVLQDDENDVINDSDCTSDTENNRSIENDKLKKNLFKTTTTTTATTTTNKSKTRKDENKKTNSKNQQEQQVIVVDEENEQNDKETDKKNPSKKPKLTSKESKELNVDLNEIKTNNKKMKNKKVETAMATADTDETETDNKTTTKKLTTKKKKIIKNRKDLKEDGDEEEEDEDVEGQDQVDVKVEEELNETFKDDKQPQQILHNVNNLKSTTKKKDEKNVDAKSTKNKKIDDDDDEGGNVDGNENRGDETEGKSDQPENKTTKKKTNKKDKKKNKKVKKVQKQNEDDANANTNPDKEEQPNESGAGNKSSKKKSNENEQTKSKTKTTLSRIDSKETKMLLKTPSVKNRLSRLEMLQSTLKKSLKPKRPLTRRAAAAAAAAAVAVNSASTTASVTTATATTTMKKIVNSKSNNNLASQETNAALAKSTKKGDTVSKLINKFELSTNKTPSVHRKISNLGYLQNTISKLKTIRGSIDNRKLRLSQAKLEAKRKSVKQAQAFLNHIKSSAKKTNGKLLSKLGAKPDENKNKAELIEEDVTQAMLMNEDRVVATTSSGGGGEGCDDNAIKQSPRVNNTNSDEFKKITITTDNESKRLTITANTQKEEEIINKILKSNSPKLVVSKIPLSLISSSTSSVSATKATAVLSEQQRQLTRDLILSQAIQQQYRVIVAPSSKVQATPSKSSSIYQLGTSMASSNGQLNNLAPPTSTANNRTSFAKFLERNTPSKLTRTELDERRKVELMAKEVKEKERLMEIEKQKQEKRDELKKKRDEKMKKINEQKAKRQEEFEARARELEKKRKELEKQCAQPQLQSQSQQQQQQITKPLSANNSVNTNQTRTLNTTMSASSILTTSNSTTITQTLHHSQSQFQFPTQSSQSNQLNLKSSYVVLSQLNLHNLNPINKLTSGQVGQSSTNELNSLKQMTNQYNKQTNSAVVPIADSVLNYENKFKTATNKPTIYHQENNNNNNMTKTLETTYVLCSPSSTGHSENAFGGGGGGAAGYGFNMSKHTFSNYEVTPLQPPKLKNSENYDVSDLRSEDETDDDEEPSKPIPDWAKDPQLANKVKHQNLHAINFTKLFRAASQSEVNLEKIFKTKKKKFVERSSSANWNSPPVWRTNGLNGEESFRYFRKHY